MQNEAMSVTERREEEAVLPPLNLALRALLAAILFLAAYLRLHSLGKSSLWLDEILNYEIVSELKRIEWWQWLTGFERENGPLYYLVQLAGRSASGWGVEVSTRIAPALFGIVTVALIFQAARRYSRSNVTACVAALLMAVSPLHVYYSREGRPYALLMLLATAILLVLARRRVVSWYLLALFAALAYTAATAAPFLGAMFLAGVTLFSFRTSHRTTGVRVILAAVMSILLLGLLYARFEQMERGTEYPELKSALAFQVVNSLGVTAFDRSDLRAVPLLMLLLAISGAVHLAGVSRRNALLLIILTAGTLAISLLSLRVLAHWYASRYIALALPGFLVLLSAGITALAATLTKVLPISFRERGVPVTAAVIALLLAYGGYENARRESRQKLDWRGITTRLQNAALSGEAVIASNHWVAHSLRFYLGQIPQSSLQVIDAHESPGAAREAASRRENVWLATGGYDRPEISAWMRTHQMLMEKESPVESIGIYFKGTSGQLTERVVTGALFDRLAATFVNGRRGGVGLEPADSQLLLSGWHDAERVEKSWYRWVRGREAALILPVPGQVEARLRVRAMPFDVPLQPQTLSLFVNGKDVGKKMMRAGWSDYDFSVPATLWRDGFDAVTLRFERSWRPSDDAVSGDTRELSAAVDEIWYLPSSE